LLSGWLIICHFSGSAGLLRIRRFVPLSGAEVVLAAHLVCDRKLGPTASEPGHTLPQPTPHLAISDVVRTLDHAPPQMQPIIDQQAIRSDSPVSAGTRFVPYYTVTSAHELARWLRTWL